MDISRNSSFMLACAGLLALFSPVAVTAQSSPGTISASTTILGFLDVSQQEALAFGTLLPTAGALLLPGIAAGADQSVGRLRVRHTAALAVSAQLPAGLSLAGQPDLPVSFACGFSASPHGSLDGAVESCADIAVRPGSDDGAMRESYLQVGGSILPADTTDRPAGTYTGTLVFTFTAVY
jgi:hypothetical protein